MSTIAVGRNGRRPKVANEELGMLVFIVTELMFFAALISAYLVIKASSLTYWVPPLDIRLPVLATGFNTAVLLTSGFVIYKSGGILETDRPRAIFWLQLGAMLGLFFVGFQGYEWVQLISKGMTMTSGVFGACFFLLIGSHGLHAMLSVLSLLWALWGLKRNKVTAAQYKALRIFWYFVVGVWPVLYTLVYY